MMASRKLGERVFPSFRRKSLGRLGTLSFSNGPESSLFSPLTILWTPVFTGVTTFLKSSSILEGRIKIVALFFIVMSAVACAGHAQESRSATPTDLAPCPDSPNCVSTRSKEPDRTMPPLPYLNSGRESMDRLVDVVRQMKRATIVSATPSYLHVEFRSALFRFVDDVEFLMEDSARLIHFRSASRTGYYDFGVNRKRMKDISDRYLRSADKRD
jgi:uncharacterized protein (DUF1499 family)